MVPLNIQIYSNLLRSSSGLPEHVEMLDEIAKYIWHRTRSDFKDDIIFKQKNVVLYYLALFIKNGEVKLDFITEVIILFFLIM